MRVFIGINISPEARELVLDKLKPFTKMKTPIRWVAPENIHLTLKFLGEVSADLYARVDEVLHEPWNGFSPFTAVIRGFGKFPPGRRLAIFWVGMDLSPELQKLQTEVETRLAAFAFKKEDRPYTPHITLGRNKAEYNFKSLFAKLEDYQDVLIATTPVTSFQVFESTLTPKGPVYNVLKEIPLA